MISRLAPILLSMSGLLVAADTAQFLAGQKVQVSHTDRLNLPAGGTLHLRHSFGELGIEGWDRPEVEITVVKSTRDYYPSAESPKGMAELERVHISSAVEGKDVVVTTGSPHRAFPPSLPWAEPAIDVEYRIKAPMDAAVVVEHGAGEVHFYNLSGDIHAEVRNGGITLDLPAASNYAMGADSHWGTVISGFPGSLHRRFWVVGHRFTRTSTDGAHKLVLKAGYGDIVILKAWQPEATH